MKNLLLTDRQEDLSFVNVLYTAEKHWISFVGSSLYVLVGLLGVVVLSFGMGYMKFIGIALLYLLFKGLMGVLTKITTKIYLSANYLTISEGILGKDVTDIPLNKLEGIILSQSLFGKLFNYGNLIITTGGVYRQQYIIKNPKELRKRIINR